MNYLLVGFVITMFMALPAAGQAIPVLSLEEEKVIGEGVENARKRLSDFEREVLNDRRGVDERARAVIGKFLSAPNYKKRLEFVRERNRVEPLMKMFYAENPDAPIKFRKFDLEKNLSVYQSLALDKVVTEDFRELSVAVEWQKGGTFLVDWESFVGYCEIPWDQIAKKRSTKPFLVRARAAVGGYYNNGFDDDEWSCVRLEDINRRHALYAYSKTDSPLTEELAELLQKSEDGCYVTVKIAYPEDGMGGKNQLLLTELVNQGWVSAKISEDQEK